MAGCGRQYVVVRVSGINGILCIAKKLGECGSTCLDALRCEHSGELRPERRRVEYGRYEFAARADKTACANRGGTRSAEKHAADNRTEGLPKKVDAFAVNVGQPVAVQVEPGQRPGQRQQVGDSFPQVVARGKQTGNIDEESSRWIDTAIGPRGQSRVIHKVEVERALVRRIV